MAKPVPAKYQNAKMLNQISLEEKIALVSGDGGYDTNGRHEEIAQRQAEEVQISLV